MSNAALTGGGAVFEHEVQAAFVALMVTGGYAPALPIWPIVRVALQTKMEGYHTDDCLIRVEQPGGVEFRHLLCQIKRQISRGGLEAVLSLAREVDGASEVGYALMQALAGRDDAKVVNAVLLSDDPKLRQLGKIFIHSRTVEGGGARLDGIDVTNFSADSRAIFYAALPFGPAPGPAPLLPGLMWGYLLEKGGATSMEVGRRRHRHPGACPGWPRLGRA